MGYNDGAGAQYPGNVAQINALMDKVGASTFQAAGKVINTGDESYTVPNTAPYCIRLNLVPQETLDNTGNPTGVNLAGLVEMPWDANTAPKSGKFMTNYINGEVKFAADMAGMNVEPGYTGTGSWFWAEVINKVVRELLSVQNVLGVNPMAAFQSVAARIAATESEVSAARGGDMNLNTRLNGIDAAIAPLSGASFTDKQPNAQTGVLGSAALVLTTDLYLDPNTVSNATIKLKNSAGVDQPLTAVTYDKTTKKITCTHAALLDDVYTAYTLAGINDALGRAVAPISWIYGVGSALANAKPTVSDITVTNPSQTGFTVKGAESDTESDAVARIDVGYSTTNDVATAVIQQLTGADITAFLGAGKTLAVALAAGNYYIWDRAVETLSGGGQQVGDWVAGGTFTVLSDQPPAGLNPAKLTVSNPTQTGVSWQYNPGTDAAPTDPDDPTAVISFNVQIDSGAITNYTWAQIQTLHSVTGLSKAVGGTYQVGIQVQAVTGAKTEYSSWATVTSSAVLVNAAPVASNVNITGTPYVGDTLTGAYVYSDAEADTEGTSTFKWYSGTQSNGSDKAVIAGATVKAYVVQSGDVGKYLFFEVTPVAQTGTLTGTPVVSAGVIATDTFTANFTAASDLTNYFGTSKVGATAIAVDTGNGVLSISGEAATSDAGIVYVKSPVSKTKTRTYSHKVKGGSSDTTSNYALLHMGQFAATPAINTSANFNTSLRILFGTNGETAVYLRYKRQSDGAVVYWDEASQVWTNTSTPQYTVPTLASNYVQCIVETTATQFRMTLKSGDGVTTYATSAWVNWTDLYDDASGNPMYAWWGDPYTDANNANYVTDSFSVA